MNKLKIIWQNSNWQLRALAIAFVMLVVGYAIFSASDFIHNKRTEKAINAATQRADDAEAKAAAKITEANNANTENTRLKSQLDQVNQDLQNLQSSLTTATKQTNAARIIYVQTKQNPQPVFIPSGDDDTDRARLFAEYKQLRAEAQH